MHYLQFLDFLNGKKMSKIIRIALIGPECSGKSTLAEQLAKHYQTVFVSEYARTFLEKGNLVLNSNDVLKIAKIQLKNEKTAIAKAKKIIFTDTELIYCKVWNKEVFESGSKWFDKKINETTYDFYLLTKPDLPWKKDAVRTKEENRNYLFDCYKDELEKLNANFSVVGGLDNSRLMNCLKIIEENFGSQL